MPKQKGIRLRIRALIPTTHQQVFDQAPDPDDPDFLKTMVAYSWAQEVRLMGLLELEPDPSIKKTYSTQIISLRSDRARLIQLFRVSMPSGAGDGETYAEPYPGIDETPPRSLDG